VVGEKNKAQEIEPTEGYARSDTSVIPHRQVYLGLGDIDTMFELLRKAYERYGYLAYLEIEPMFDRHGSRYENWARRD
jgi:hypothetical protein